MKKKNKKDDKTYKFITKYMDKFDACCFGNRKHWKIFIELSQQPAEGPDGE